ncbi:hypothetical protein NIES4072_67670 [Nostoc commune NIES-4072]|uniref:Uncharacterized protein n=1 Tax=Nostoc commune NIES-4072 TaxID=2005467 RepID=A0A2R5FXR6_NOSCO|nr:hypothetical protein [Nostoc commune]BBD70401.1 hypothetical protein NIES4070_68120 [Nostoc commune HK-02]GBG23055.1 hypothetical protein NIES4072_67670 [Nostoc commune NIES-4072]
MEIKLTTSEIRTILQGCQYTLQLLGSSKDYRRLQSSEYFSTSNGVVLNNAFNILGEIVNAIDEVEQMTEQQTEKI